MMKFLLLSLCISFLCQTAWGIYFSFERNNENSSFSSSPKIMEEPDANIFTSNESSEIYNSSTYRTEEGNVDPSQISTTENSSLINKSNSLLPSSKQSLTSTYSTVSNPSTSSIGNKETLATVFNNESQSQSSTQLSSSESSVNNDKGTDSIKTSNISITPSSNEANETYVTSEDELEGVARGKPSSTESTNATTAQTQSLYEKTWALISDTYTLSILLPVAAGVVFATTILLTIAMCRCLRRCCIRRRLRKKILPDSVKNLRPSDRARLLAESSDEEF